MITDENPENNMSYIFAIFFWIALLTLIVKFLGNKSLNKRRSLYNYRRTNFLMSRAEHQFFDVLIDILENKYYVFPQIHLNDILDFEIKGQNWKRAFFHINKQSVDFVICDKAYIKPLIAIELDDKSHNLERRKERDARVENILAEAGLPLLRFGNNGSFYKEGIKNEIFKILNNETKINKIEPT